MHEICLLYTLLLATYSCLSLKEAAKNAKELVAEEEKLKKKAEKKKLKKMVMLALHTCAINAKIRYNPNWGK